MRNALIGYTGLVGSHLLRQRSFSHLYNSSNIESISGECFDEVFCVNDLRDNDRFHFNNDCAFASIHSPLFHKKN